MSTDQSQSIMTSGSEGGDSKISEESLSMFFDSDFNAANYIDKLFQNITNSSITTGATPISTYSKNSLEHLSNNISDLSTHLDYYTTELASQSLTVKLDTLNHSNLPILPKESDKITDDLFTGTSNNNNSNQELTRLKYYINVLNNSIISLQADLSSIHSDVIMDEEERKKIRKQDETIKSLTSLKTVKSNLINVLQIFEFLNNAFVQTLKSSNTIQYEQNEVNISIEDFQQLLNELFDTLKSQLIENKGTAKLDDVIKYITKLIDLGTIFNNLSTFNSPFKKFINNLTTELAKYQ
ncbi:uncharacterized protein RJT21DRAFT_121331 [Scheffersomyces amazonensis]|uniref:uncharacterized protein n=1 Tax=Scheffersomyces amazonensis TaxID=1078765 RepID=UPI00315D924D